MYLGSGVESIAAPLLD